MSLATPADRYAQEEIRLELERASGCELRRFGPYAPVDFYALRDGRIVALIEAKARTHHSSRYPTVYLSVRKWYALMLAEFGLEAHAYYAVRFVDGIRVIRARAIDARNLELAGRYDRGLPNDLEPMIAVPVDAMRELKP